MVFVIFLLLGYVEAEETHWGGVASVEADGDISCDTAHGLSFGIGPFSWSYAVPDWGCYRLDAYAGAERCEFGGTQEVEVSWCKGKYASLPHVQEQGWSTLGYFEFNPHHPPVQVQQDSGPVDAFRFVFMGSRCDNHPGALVSFRVDADFDSVDASFLDDAKEMFPWARVLGVSRGSVVVDLELLEEPSPDMVQAAAELVCGRVSAGPECASSAELWRGPAPQDGVLQPQFGNRKSRGLVLFAIVAGIAVGSVVVVCAILRARAACMRRAQKRSEVLKVQDVEKGAVSGVVGGVVIPGLVTEEKVEVDDDNASTATPNSLDNSVDNSVDNSMDSHPINNVS